MRDVDAADELVAVRETIALYRQLSNLAGQGAELSAVTDLLAERIDADAWIIDENLRIKAATSRDEAQEALDCVLKEGSPGEWDRLMRMAADSRVAVRSTASSHGRAVIVAPIVVNGEVCDYLLTMEPKQQHLAEAALLVSEHAAMISGVILSRERVIAEAYDDAREVLIEGILLGRSNDPSELSRWARYIGYDETLTYRVLVIRVHEEASGSLDDRRQRRVRDWIDHSCRSRTRLAVTLKRESEVVVLAPDDRKDGAPTPSELGNACAADCRELVPQARLAIGVSGRIDCVTRLPHAYREALRATEIASQLRHFDEAMTFEGLGAVRLLLDVRDVKDLRQFIDETVGSIIEYDQRHGGQLLETLAAFFHSAASPHRTGELLHVHPNTVAYRLKRIQEISTLDLAQYRDRLSAQVALELVEVLGVPGG